MLNLLFLTSIRTIDNDDHRLAVAVAVVVFAFAAACIDRVDSLHEGYVEVQHIGDNDGDDDVWVDLLQADAETETEETVADTDGVSLGELTVSNVVVIYYQLFHQQLQI
mmetsp:Transcript_23518/g.26230  ORF Transcript_23518/g.26230 Transcript_23518/m.26230 type:complete len:109 (+) Transcript_23518:590-916(+)